jgi:predicted O-methyltransferase YrrM
VNTVRRQLAEAIHARGQAHDRSLADKLERFRNLEPSSAQLLGVLVRAGGAQRILELGTSNGYSTIWLADAAEATGGSVTSVDLDAQRVEQARASLRQATLEKIVELRHQDAADALRESEDEHWDFVFLDAERPAYASYLADLVRVLAPGGMLAVDNALSHEQDLVEFNRLVEDEPCLTQTVVPVGAGLRLAVRER